MGKPNVTAALTLPDYFTRCVGIELLDGLHKKSLELITAYSESEWAADRRSQGLNCPEISYVKDDFIENYEQWVSQASIIFANATCFEPDMLEKVSTFLRIRFEPGQVFILTTKELDVPDEDFIKVGPLVRRMSWGET